MYISTNFCWQTPFPLGETAVPKRQYQEYTSPAEVTDFKAPGLSAGGGARESHPGVLIRKDGSIA